MKKCTYCGKEYGDETKLCPLDAQPLASSGAKGDWINPEPEPDQPVADHNVLQAAAKRNMMLGGMWFVGGVIVTVTSFVAASGPAGGSYMVAWGAIFFGGMQFFRGLSARNAVETPRSPEPNFPTTNRYTGPSEPVSRTCPTCGEQLESQSTSCRKCQTDRNDSASEPMIVGTKRVYWSPDGMQVSFVRSMLESANISVEVRNECVSQVMVGYQFATELWVRDEDVPEACRLIAQLKSK